MIAYMYGGEYISNKDGNRQNEAMYLTRSYTKVAYRYTESTPLQLFALSTALELKTQRGPSCCELPEWLHMKHIAVQ